MKVIIEVPKWIVSTRATIMYWYNSCKWIVNPPRCECCNARMHAKWYHMEYMNEMNHTRLMVENHGKQTMCPSCIIKEVETTTPSKSTVMYDYDRQSTCDCCQREDTEAYRFFETDKIRLHFCLQWWNGFHICKRCILNALRTGRVSTSMLAFHKNKSIHVGAYGLHLHNSKVKLFKWVNW